MKKIIFALGAAVWIVSCSSSETGNKEQQLDNLKKEASAIREKIVKLEAEIAAEDTTQKVNSKIVSVTEMKQQPFSHYIEVQAKVEGDEDVMVSAESMGAVTAINVKAGDKVSKGQVMATLDDRTVQQSMEALKTQLELATTLYNRQKNLWDQKIGSEVQYLNAKTQKESLERQVAALQNQWDLSRIKSPINGTVDEVKIKTGQMMAPGIPAIRVVNLSSLKVKGEVAEAYITAVNRNNPVKIYFPDTGKEIEAKVDYSGKVINPLNRTFNVEVRLKPSQGEFHPNQVAILKISDYTNSDAIVVPVGAVMKSTYGEFVFVADGTSKQFKAKRKTVKSGKSYNGNIEITDGLSANDKVVTFGYQNLVEGDVISY